MGNTIGPTASAVRMATTALLAASDDGDIDETQLEALSETAHEAMDALTSMQKANDQARASRKALAKQRLEQLQQRLMLLKLTARTSEAAARELARLARELKSIAHDYRSAGSASDDADSAADIETANQMVDALDAKLADATAATTADDTSSGDTTEGGTMAATTTAGTPTTAEDEGQGENEDNGSDGGTPGLSQETAESDADRQFANDLRRMAEWLKALLHGLELTRGSDEDRGRDLARKDVEAALRDAKAIGTSALSGLSGANVLV